MCMCVMLQLLFWTICYQNTQMHALLLLCPYTITHGGSSQHFKFFKVHEVLFCLLLELTAITGNHKWSALNTGADGV